MYDYLMNLKAENIEVSPRAGRWFDFILPESQSIGLRNQLVRRSVEELSDDDRDKFNLFCADVNLDVNDMEGWKDLEWDVSYDSDCNTISIVLRAFRNDEDHKIRLDTQLTNEESQHLASLTKSSMLHQLAAAPSINEMDLNLMSTLAKQDFEEFANIIQRRIFAGEAVRSANPREFIIQNVIRYIPNLTEVRLISNCYTAKVSDTLSVQIGRPDNFFRVMLFDRKLGNVGSFDIYDYPLFGERVHSYDERSYIIAASAIYNYIYNFTG